MVYGLAGRCCAGRAARDPCWLQRVCRLRRGLVLDDPDRFAGAAILYGTLPFDAGVPTTPGRLQGIPMFVAHGDADSVIPAELLKSTWSYLTEESGAQTISIRSAGGHSIGQDDATALARWITDLQGP